MTESPSKRSFRDSLRFYGPVILVTVVAFLIAWQFIEPAPPKTIKIATGRAGGAYHATGEKLQRALAEQGITAELVPSTGALDNIGRLGRGEVDVAFVQGGVRPPSDQTTGGEPDRFVAIASLYYEPLWIFGTPSNTPDLITDLANRRLAIGPPGSGTRAVSMQLLADNGVGASATNLTPLGGSSAVDALLAGEIDFAFLVGSTSDEAIGRLLRSEQVKLFDCKRTEAYSRRHRYLSAIELPRGAIDPGADLPPTDIHLVAPTAQIIAHEEFHPALVDLLLDIAAPLFKSGDLVQDEPEFPSLAYIDYPASPISERYFRSGRPFLYRVLPFGLAAFLDRIKILLLPLLTLLIPLVKMVPPIYAWRIRSRIFRWYTELVRIETSAETQDHAICAADLDRLGLEVAKVTVPASYTDDLYHLKQHIEYVRTRLMRSATKEA